jgi:hypothetical protein
VPFDVSLDHFTVAESLLIERDRVCERLPELAEVPFFWVGHSLGCKLIALLEAYTDPEHNLFLPPNCSPATARRGIFDEPSLLIAPSIGDTTAALPVPILPQILDALGLGVRPTRAETQRLILEDELFHLTALISFDDDRVAGSATGSPVKSDVAWFIAALGARRGSTLIHRELAGGHLVPLGIRLADVVLEIDPCPGLLPATPPAELERTALELLDALRKRREAGIKRRMVDETTSNRERLVLKPFGQS